MKFSSVSDDELVSSYGIPFLLHLELSHSVRYASLSSWFLNYARKSCCGNSNEEVYAAFDRMLSLLESAKYISVLHTFSPVVSITSTGRSLVLPLIQLVKPKTKLSAQKKSGDKGEETTARRLQKVPVPGHRRILRNVILKSSERKMLAEIDILLVSEYGIFVIENKEIAGVIRGGMTEENWMRLWYGSGKTAVSPLVNPILQNRKHVSCLANELHMAAKRYFYSIAVFPERAVLKVKGNGKAREFVVTREKIAATILGAIKNSEKVLSADEVDEIVLRMM